MAFTYKRSLTVDHTKAGGSLTDFPVLVSFTRSEFKTVANGGKVEHGSGFDLAFFSDFALTTQLDHEIEKYVASTGELVAWVRLPTLSNSVDTIFYVGYGDASISSSQESAADVWDANYIGVWHLNGSMNDSTGNGNHLTDNSSSNVTGQISTARGFNGSTQYLNRVAPLTTFPVTLSAWFKATTSGFQRAAHISAVAGDTLCSLLLNYPSAGNLTGQNFRLGSGNSFLPTATASFTASTWAYGVTTQSATVASIFINGGNKASVTGWDSPVVDKLGVARNSDNTQYLDGSVDEVRLSDIVRADAWILTEYNNQLSPASFVSLGAEHPLTVTTGLIYATDFPDLTGWTAGGDFAVDTTRPTYIAAPRSQILTIEGTPAGTDAQGTREPCLLEDDDGTWYLYYDAGDGTGGAGGPWRVHTAWSDDRGLTWTKEGPTNIGLDKTSTPADGAYPARGLCGVEKRGSAYIMEMLSAGAVGTGDFVNIPSQPYESDVFTATDPLGPWTFVRRSSVQTGSGYDALDSYMGCHVEDSPGSFQGFFGATNGSGDYRIGRATASSATGPWTKIGAALPSGIEGDPENPRVWWSAVLNKWVMLCNMVTGGVTDQNSLFLSDSLTDWSGCYRRNIQGLMSADASVAIGMGTPIGITGGLPFEDDDYIGFTFDADPNGDSTKHNGRKVFYSVLEPSATALKYTGSSLNTARRSLAHDNFEAEFMCEFDSLPGSDHVSFDFRIQGSGDCYRLMVQGGDGLKLQKIVSGTPTDIGTPIGSLNTLVGFVHRIRLKAEDNTFQAWLDGELQINTIDSSYLSGVEIGVAAGGTADSRFRHLHVRKSSDISILGLTAGDEVTLRSWGGIPVATTTATDSVVTFSSVKHFPIRGYEINGVYTEVSGGFYGGEVIQASGQSFNPAWAVACNQMIGANR